MTLKRIFQTKEERAADDPSAPARPVQKAPGKFRDPASLANLKG